jgi:type III pantothenate kinase
MSNIDSIPVDKIAFLDAGNSSFKIGVRLEDQWGITSFKEPDKLAEYVKKQCIDYVITISVKPDNSWLDQLVDHAQIAVLEISDIPSEMMNYETTDTLGLDRFFACLGAFQWANKAVLVIDAGSACTLDFMDEDGVFQGGVIMPGVQSLLKVFLQSAPNLPRFPFQIPDSFPGKSSNESLQWGLSQLFVDGINANIVRYQEKYTDFEIFVTGGDAELVAQYIEEECVVRPDLIFTGMEALLSES